MKTFLLKLGNNLEFMKILEINEKIDAIDDTKPINVGVK